MPRHRHSYQPLLSISTQPPNQAYVYHLDGPRATEYTGYTGGGQPHNLMQLSGRRASSRRH